VRQLQVTGGFRNPFWCGYIRGRIKFSSFSPQPLTPPLSICTVNTHKHRHTHTHTQTQAYIYIYILYIYIYVTYNIVYPGVLFTGMIINP